MFICSCMFVLLIIVCVGLFWFLCLCVFVVQWMSVRHLRVVMEVCVPMVSSVSSATVHHHSMAHSVNMVRWHACIAVMVVCMYVCIYVYVFVCAAQNSALSSSLLSDCIFHPSVLSFYFLSTCCRFFSFFFSVDLFLFSLYLANNNLLSVFLCVPYVKLADPFHNISHIHAQCSIDIPPSGARTVCVLCQLRVPSHTIIMYLVALQIMHWPNETSATACCWSVFF